MVNGSFGDDPAPDPNVLIGTRHEIDTGHSGYLKARFTSLNIGLYYGIGRREPMLERCSARVRAVPIDGEDEVGADQLAVATARATSGEFGIVEPSGVS